MIVPLANYFSATKIVMTYVEDSERLPEAEGKPAFNPPPCICQSHLVLGTDTEGCSSCCCRIPDGTGSVPQVLIGQFRHNVLLLTQS